MNSINLTKILTQLAKFRSLIATVAVMALIGYAGLQISSVVNAKPDPDYLQQKEAQLDAIQLKTNSKTIQQLEQLQSGGNDTVTVAPGKQNPFAP